jgi:hypothetical protein
MFFLELQYHDTSIKVLFHLGLWMFLLEATSVYECFGDGSIRFARSFLRPTFNHHYKEVFILKVRFFTLYFVRASYIQVCRKLIVEKVCDNVSFLFKLFIEALPLVVILDALKFCVESLLSSCPTLYWSFHALSLSFSCVEAFMISSHPYGWVEALRWNFEVSSQQLDAFKLHIVQLQRFNLVRCIEVILCWIFRVSSCLLGALKFVLKLQVFWLGVLKLQLRL